METRLSTQAREAKLLKAQAIRGREQWLRTCDPVGKQRKETLH